MIPKHRKIWTEFREKKSQKITHKEFQMVCDLHSKYYNHRYYEPCTCNPKTIQRWIKDLNDVF